MILIFMFCNTIYGQHLKVANEYLNHSDYKNAIAFFEKAQIDSKTNSDISLFVEAQNGIATCYIELGANYKAMNLLQENITRLSKDKTKNYELLAKTHLLLADCYNNLFRLEDYLKECHLFYGFYQKAFPDTIIYKALYYSYLGRYYNLRYMIKDAYKYTNTALKIYHNNKKEAHLIDPYLLYNAHSFTIRNHLPFAQYKEKLKYTDSLTYFLNKKFPYDNLKKSRVLISIAAPSLDLATSLYSKNKNDDLVFAEMHANKAISIYTEALRINDQLAGYYYQNSAFANSLRGLMYFYKGDYENALKDYDEGIARLNAPKDLSPYDFCNNNPLLSETLNWKAWCLDDMYESTKDISLLFKIETTLLEMEKVWLRYTQEIIKFKKDYNSSIYVLQPYNNLTRVYYNLYIATKKQKYLSLYFKYDDKSKYAALFENLIQQKHRKGKDLKNSKSTYLSFEDLLLKINDKANLKSTKVEYANAFAKDFLKYQKTTTEEAIFKNNKNTNLQGVQSKLKNNEAIVSYTISGNQYNYYITVLLISQQKLEVIKLPTDYNPDFAMDKPLVSALVSCLETNNISNYKKIAYLTYQNYFHPIERYLPRTIKHIKIIPCINIVNLPFDLLLSQPSTSMDYRKLSYLGNKFQFSYAMSESISTIVDERNEKKSGFSISTPDFIDSKLNSLSIANKTAKDLSETYQSKWTSGKFATKRSFSNQLTNSSVLALFSHGKASTDDIKDENGVYLSDGFLSLNEIYDLNSSCDFLILGACETAVGDYNKSEGNINLARAFTSIGVKSMMLSSWKIDEKSSMKITKSFLHYLQQGNSKSEALQKAKIDFLKASSPKTANPLYWAGLNITGNNENIILKTRTNLIWYVLGLLTMSVSAFMYYRKKKKH